MAANLFGYNDNGTAPPETHFDPNDPRLVTIFVSIPEAFSDPDVKNVPDHGLHHGLHHRVRQARRRRQRHLGRSVPRRPPARLLGRHPADIDDCQGPDCDNYVLWGHIVKMAVPGPRGRPSGVQCNPGVSWSRASPSWSNRRSGARRLGRAMCYCSVELM